MKLTYYCKVALLEACNSNQLIGVALRKLVNSDLCRSLYIYMSTKQGGGFHVHTDSKSRLQKRALPVKKKHIRWYHSASTSIKLIRIGHDPVYILNGYHNRTNNYVNGTGFDTHRVNFNRYDDFPGV